MKRKSKESTNIDVDIIMDYVKIQSQISDNQIIPRIIERLTNLEPKEFFSSTLYELPKIKRRNKGD